MLPTGLTHLALRLPADQTLFGSLLRGITRFSSLNEDGERSALDASFSLPEGLVHLSTSFHPNQGSTNALRVPKSVRHLRTLEWRFEHLASLPSTLTSLSIERLDPEPGVTLLNFKEVLPTSLRSLQIDSVTSGVVSVQSASYSRLRNLKTLRLQKALIHSSSVMRHLPSFLTILSFGLESLEDEDTPFLPPYLEQCELHSDTIHLNDLLGLYWPLATFDTVKRQSFFPDLALVEMRNRRKLLGINDPR